jgi:hypothetical protein
VYALANKMEAFRLPLIVKEFKLQDPLEKELVSESELLRRDLALVHDSDGDHELTVMLVVWRREYPVE